MALHRDRVDQERANLLKTVRAAVRLRHSIAADNELNEILPMVEAKFNKSVQKGVLPDPLSIRRAVGL